ncbi:MAG: uracil-DNA glycosylase [Wenzhouxiangellaceae bacterium]|nr:uracil-DNA glycosylase [Wenzhouxiangellaceae bacterium]
MSKSEPIDLHFDDLNSEWQKKLCSEWEKPYMQQLRQFLARRKADGTTIYPPAHHVLSALDSTPPARTRVVILGQDPYHGPGQAHGLCFSVRPGVQVPPSLRNIFKELHDDIGFEIPGHGCLQSWADRGVLLLNAVLTVEQGRPGSHRGRGWERFTDRVIEILGQGNQPLVFLLWGNQAQRKGSDVDRDRHLVLTAPHPSPLSAHRGFLGCRHFSRTNQWLKAQGLKPVDWSLAEIDAR